MFHWGRHSLTARTLLFGGAFAALLAVGFAVLVIAIGGLRGAGKSALRAQEAVTVGTELERSVVALENGLRGFVATGEAEELAPFENARRAYPKQVARLVALARDEPRIGEAVEEAATLISDYVGLWAEPLLDVHRERPASARALLSDFRGRQRITEIRAALDRVSDRADTAAAATARAANRRADVAVALGVVGIVLVVLIAGGTAVLLRRRVLGPISRVAAASERVAGGDLRVRVTSTRTDELGALARAFNTMTESLAERTEALERSNRELEDYASVTSHDLQGPLVTIGMYAGLLEKRLAGEPEAHRLASHIRSGAERMRALTRDLLGYARLEREVAEPAPVALATTLEEALDSLAGPIGDRGAEIDVTAELPAVLGDAGRLRQVFQNLLTNAIKFSDEAVPRVTVSAAETGGSVQVTVADNGIGFAPGQAELIFRPFQRLHSADRFEGTGIGLAVCQKIVEQHGGRIWADGEPGAGARFHFTLPLVGSSNGGTEPRTAVGAPAGGGARS